MAKIKIPDDRLRQVEAEIEMSRALNREELEPRVREATERYTGEFIPAFGAGWDIMLNEVYPIIQSNLPSIFFRNPRAFLKPRNKTYLRKKRNPLNGKMEMTQEDSTKSARTQEHLLNYTIEEIKYKQEVRKVLLDALLFPHGVLWHGYKGDFGMTEEQSIFIKNDMVFVSRLSPLRFIKDPSVSMSNIAEAKWVGRVMDIPLLDVLEDDRLDVDKAAIKGVEGFGDKIGNRKHRGVANDNVPMKRLIDFTDGDFRPAVCAG